MRPVGKGETRNYGATKIKIPMAIHTMAILSRNNIMSSDPMSDSVSNLGPAAAESVPHETPPEFGFVDIIEAFTAMRHEWRGQTKESRGVAESVQAAMSNIRELETKLLAQAASGSTDESRKLAQLVAEIDNQLTRAVAVAGRCEANRKQREESKSKALQHYFDGMHAMARWFARPLLMFVTEQRRAEEQIPEDAAVEGLNLVLAQLRHTMKENQIQRIDALGQPFDAETMNAIGTIVSQDYPAGHVAEQLSPCYRWRGSILRFADVRVVS